MVGGVPHCRHQAWLRLLFSSPVHSGTTDHPSACVGKGWYPEIFIAPHPILPQESGLIQLLRRDIAAVFRDHRMIAVCQNVAMSTEDKLLLQHQLRKHRILIKVFPNQVGLPRLRPAFLPCLLRGPGSCCSSRTLPTSVLVDKLPSLVPKLWVGTEEMLRHSLGLRYVAFPSCPPLAILSCDPRS